MSANHTNQKNRQKDSIEYKRTFVKNNWELLDQETKDLLIISGFKVDEKTQ